MRRLALLVAFVGLFHVSATPAPFDTGRTGWWTESVENDDFFGNSIHLYARSLEEARLTSKVLLDNGTFVVSFDFKINQAESSGGAEGLFAAYQYPSRVQYWETPRYYWRVRLNDRRLVTYTLQGGRDRLDVVSPTLLSRDEWYHLKIENRPDSVTLHLSHAESGEKIVSRTLPHDLGLDSPTPLEFFADAELRGIRRPVVAPLNTVWAEYYVRKMGLKAPISVGGELRDVVVIPTAASVESRPGRQLGKIGRFLVGQGMSGGMQVGNDRDGVVVSLPGAKSLLGGRPSEPPSPWQPQSLALDIGKRRIVQAWRNSEIPVELRILLEFFPDKSYWALSMEVENLSEQPEVLDVVLKLLPSGPETNWQRAYTFPHLNPGWKECFETGTYPFEMDLVESPVASAWGTRALGWGVERGVNLALPVVALRHGDTGAGTVFCWDNATSFKFAADPGEVRVQRRFYLRGEKGFVDRGLDVGDGGPPVPHRITIGHASEVDWPVLYNDFYLDAYPLYKFEKSNLKEAIVPGLFGGHEAMYTQHPWTEESARAQALAGIRYAHLWSAHANHPRLNRDFNLDRIDWATKYGMVPAFNDNCMVAPISNHHFDPEQHYSSFEDALVYSPEGYGPCINWEGMLVNQSPRFSFGRSELELIKKAVGEHGYGMGYLDLYFYGPQSDFSHSYEHLPFYPFSVGLTEFVRDLSQWLQARGIPYTLNGPHPGSNIVQFGDVIQWDGHDWGLFAPFFKPISGCKLNVTYAVASWGVPDREIYKGRMGKMLYNMGWSMLNGKVYNLLRYDLYGFSEAKWLVDDLQERAEMIDVINQNVTLGFAIGQARLVAGQVFRSYQYRNPAGDVFLTVYNHAKDRATIAMKPDWKRLPIDPDRDYSIFEWSLVDGATPLSLRVQGADVPDTIPITLEGGEIKLVLVLAHEPTIRRDYLAMNEDSGVLVRSSSGRIVATQSDDSGFSLDVDAVPDRRTVTRIVVPDGMEISVEGAKTSSVEPQGRWQTVTVVHGERPARIRVSRE